MKKLLLWIWFWLSGKRRHALSGKLIVFESIDGSGKETQFRQFLGLLNKSKVPYKTFDFPQYNITRAGHAVYLALHGGLGVDPSKIPVKALSMYYALDRAVAAPHIRRALHLGYVVVLNRYTTSNRGHQAWKHETQEEIKEYLNWLDDLEHGKFEIPKEDVVLFYNISIKNAVMLINSRDRVNDKVEVDINYLTKSLEMYRQLAKDNDHWITIECEDENDNLLSIEEIHKRTINAIRVMKK